MRISALDIVFEQTALLFEEALSFGIMGYQCKGVTTRKAARDRIRVNPASQICPVISPGEIHMPFLWNNRL